MVKINIDVLSRKLTEDPSLIVSVLEELGYSKIKDRGNYYQMANIDGDNQSAICVYKKSLRYENFTRGKSGNIFTMVMDLKHCNFPQALEKVATWLGFTSSANAFISYPFHKFYKGMHSKCNDETYEPKEYAEDELPPPNKFSKRFIDDNISALTQQEWGVRYDEEEDAILIPIYQNGKLIGCKARANAETDFGRRWWAKLPYSKSRTLYGLDKNYEDIIKEKTLYIFESEKSVMQCYDFGCRCAVAIGGHTFSETQERLIKSLMVDKIVVCFDEGISEDEIEFEASKLVIGSPIVQSKVGYIFDEEHNYLPSGSKDSPSDLGAEVFNKLIKKGVVWLEF